MEIVMHYGAFGAEEDYLVEAIMRAIAEVYGDERGWPRKYGGDYANDTFAMKPYCWCEREGCLLCFGDAPNFWYKPTDFKVTWYKFIGRGMKFNRKIGIAEAAEMLYRCVVKGVADDPALHCTTEPA